MPKTKTQNFIFTLIMASLMVYGMVCYNISLSDGDFTNIVLLKAFHELPIMIPCAVLLELLFVGKLASNIAFTKMMNPQNTHPFIIVCCISACSVWLMCPLMSLAATILFKGGNSGEILAIVRSGFKGEILSTWIKTTFLNYPVAFFWQFFIAGPCTRFIFKNMFKEKMVTE